MRFWCYTIIWTNRGAFVSMHLTLFLCLMWLHQVKRECARFRVANTEHIVVYTHTSKMKFYENFFHRPWFRCTECNLFSLIFSYVYTLTHTHTFRNIHNYIDINPMGLKARTIANMWMESRETDLTHRYRSMRLNCILWLFTLCWRAKRFTDEKRICYTMLMRILIHWCKDQKISVRISFCVWIAFNDFVLRPLPKWTKWKEITTKKT